jgi:integrase/recombinase XerD
VNRKLAALTSFCGFHARLGVPLASSLVLMTAAGRHGSSATSYRPFLQHISKHGPQRRRAITLPAPVPRPQVFTAVEAQAILDACGHLRDRLLFGLLLDTGVRIGEALGLRHEDLHLAERHVVVMPRRNDNRARAKSGRSRTIPASAELTDGAIRRTSHDQGHILAPADRLHRVNRRLPRLWGGNRAGYVGHPRLVIESSGAGY